MKLLEAEVISSDYKKKEKEISERTRNLIREENKEIDELNKLKSESELQKKKIKEETDSFVVEQKDRALEALREAKAIEAFRKDVLKELLRPIDELKKEVEEKLKALEISEIAVKQTRHELEIRWTEFQNAKSELNEREKSIIKMALEFDKRQQALDDRAQQLKEFAAKKDRQIKAEMERVRRLLESKKQNG